MRLGALSAFVALVLVVQVASTDAQLLMKVSEAPQYSTLVQLVTDTNLTTTLSGVLEKGTVTIFAPNNSAFAGLDANCLTATEEKKNILRNILLFHVATAKVVAPTDGQILSTFANQNLTIVSNTTGIFVQGELVTAPAVVDDPQGVVHGLARVLIPSAKALEVVQQCSSSAPAPVLSTLSPPPPVPQAYRPTPAPAPGPSSASATMKRSYLVVLIAALVGSLI